jgi:HPt (histidine-containing phosphotransfer) domain-containing protein
VLDPGALAKLKQMLGHQSAYLKEFIDAILQTAPQRLTELQQALRRENLAELRLAAHSLKSNSADIGAGRLFELCRKLEASAKAGALTGMAEQLVEVDTAYQQVEAALRELLDKET